MLFAGALSLAPRFQTGIAGGMRRQIAALRFEVTPPPGRSGRWELIVGLGDPSVCYLQLEGGKRWCDVQAGDILITASGQRRTVLRVELFRSYGGREGQEVTSGRAWLRGE